MNYIQTYSKKSIGDYLNKLNKYRFVDEIEPNKVMILLDYK